MCKAYRQGPYIRQFLTPFFRATRSQTGATRGSPPRHGGKPARPAIFPRVAEENRCKLATYFSKRRPPGEWGFGGCPDFCVRAGSSKMEDRWHLTMKIGRASCRER